MASDSKASEKQYLSRSGSLLWERVKPFSPPATDTLAESTRLVHDFAVALNALDAAANHRILDLGAGACWTSEWLHRLNLRVVSIDIAHAMLSVGRLRAGDMPWPLVTGDLESLPFSNGSFARALCMNALHHLPRPDHALAEIARVLTPGGRLVLIEPGRGHRENPTSVKAVEQFGVLERELEASELMALCAAAGFSDVRLLPLSYATAEIALSTEQVARWRTWTRTKRPLRALRKLRLAVLELFGRAKDGELFEDALSMWVARVLVRHVGEQGVVVASKRGYAPAAGEFRAELTIDAGDRLAGRGGPSRLRVIARNTGTATWLARPGVGQVRLGAKRFDPGRGDTIGEVSRVPIEQDVPPGDSCTIVLEIGPPAAGAAQFKLDLVAEDVAWFEDRGSTPIVLDVP
jgi:ubiquinone/menaquinone biosynthesis C-methylase UbiE